MGFFKKKRIQIRNNFKGKSYLHLGCWKSFVKNVWGVWQATNTWTWRSFGCNGSQNLRQNLPSLKLTAILPLKNGWLLIRVPFLLGGPALGLFSGANMAVSCEGPGYRKKTARHWEPYIGWDAFGSVLMRFGKLSNAPLGGRKPGWF